MNLTARTFNLGNARACVRASADAYRLDTICDTATDTHCLIGEAADCIIVAFKGTTSIRNWMTDVDCKRVTLVSGDGSSKVHKGFEAALNSIFQKLYMRLGGSPALNLQNCKPIFVTGHSLGGALAALAALELQGNGFQIAQVYTFGQPRIGNGDFKKRYEAALGGRTFRLVYQEDVVARFPHLPAWHDPYRHAGSEVFISSVTTAKTTDDFWFNPPLWRLLISDAWGIYRSWLVRKFAAALDPALDHHINNYISALATVTDPADATVPNPTAIAQ